MAIELAAYGAVAGICYKFFPSRRIFLYVSLLVAMVTGRLLYGAVMALCLGASGSTYTFSAFLASTVTGALPGIVLQVLLVPLIVDRIFRVK